MKKIEKLRSAVIKAAMDANIESGRVRIIIKENVIDIVLRDKEVITGSYGEVIELYKMLQDLYSEVK